MGNSASRANTSGTDLEILSDYDENSINRGTSNMPKPQLKFHSVHGTNVHLLCDGRIARRKESFCKGLAFSKRPIGIDEIVCIRLYEVATNWSGVLRFGVTNVDPASFRDIELPKFACPDLTSKNGYWAKALAERYSVEGAILHFYVNAAGEMYYGINGVSKGIFLNGINTNQPIWIIIDIYGNSIALEFVDPNDVSIRNIRGKVQHGAPSHDISTGSSSSNEPSGSGASVVTMRLEVDSTPRQRVNRTPTGRGIPERLRFHTVKGLNISLHEDETVALRKDGEYYLGYVFTDRPLNFNERLVVMVLATEEAFSGSLAFGLTSCDPIQVPASRLPIDSDELLERPEYWVSIKDVAAAPKVGDRLSFYIENDGKVYFSKNGAMARVIMHVDVSVRLWAFFDLYGTTQKIKLYDPAAMGSCLSVGERSRTQRASSEGTSHPDLRTTPVSTRTAFDMDALRVALPPTSSTSSDNIPSTTPPSTRPLTEDFLAYSAANHANDYRQHIADSFTTSSLSALPTEPATSVFSAVSATPEARLRPVIPALSVPVRPVTMPHIFDSEPILSSLSNETGSGLNVTPLTRPGASRALGISSSTNPFADYLAPSASSLGGSQSNSTSSMPTSIDRPFRPSTQPKPPTMISSTTTPASVDEQRESSEERQSECTICMNSRVNAVIYKCGHMCMCFECATEMSRRSGDCPICRMAIVDVIRCYQI